MSRIRTSLDGGPREHVQEGEVIVADRKPAVTESTDGPRSLIVVISVDAH